MPPSRPGSRPSPTPTPSKPPINTWPNPPRIKPLRINAEYAIPNLLNRRLQINAKGKVQEVSISPIAMLVLESANRYLNSPKSFGRKSGTIDRVLKRFFSRAFDTKKKKESFKRGYKVYDKVAPLAPLKVGNRRLTTFCKTQAPIIPVKESFQKFMASNVLSKKYLVPGGIYNNLDLCRKSIEAETLSIVCNNPEEIQTPKEVQVCWWYYSFSDWRWKKACVWVHNPLYDIWCSGDEIYFTVFGAVFSADKILYKNSRTSLLTEHVGTARGHKKRPTIGPHQCRYPIQYRLHQRSTTGRLPAYYAYYAITLFEHEHSDAERRNALAAAAWDTVEIATDLLSGNFIGAAIDLGSLLYHLAVALDEDDNLLSVAYRFDNIGAIDDVEYPKTATISDTHWGNYYEYIINSEIRIKEF